MNGACSISVRRIVVQSVENTVGSEIRRSPSIIHEIPFPIVYNRFARLLPRQKTKTGDQAQKLLSISKYYIYISLFWNTKR